MPASETIQRWFAVNKGGGLILPDGWFGGRPFDNELQLSSVNEGPNSLTIILDDKVTLMFQCLASVVELDGELVLSQFAKLSCDIEAYDKPTAHTEIVYIDGEVRFVPMSHAVKR